MKKSFSRLFLLSFLSTFLGLQNSWAGSVPADSKNKRSLDQMIADLKLQEQDNALSEYLVTDLEIKNLRPFLVIDVTTPQHPFDESALLMACRKALFASPVDSVADIQNLLARLPNEKFFKERQRLLSLAIEFRFNKDASAIVEASLYQELMNNYGVSNDEKPETVIPTIALTLYYQIVKDERKIKEVGENFLQSHPEISDKNIYKLIESQS